jgi:DNA-directed RNA polymerase specialized sigma24 family protein
MTRTPPPAFLSLVRVQQESLLRAGRMLTGDWAAAEDLLRQTLAWALANWGSFEQDGTPAALVVRLRLVALFLADADPDEPPASDARTAADTGNGNGPGRAGSDDAEQSVWADDATSTIRPSTSLVDSLAVLTPRDRAVVVGRYYLSLSAVELGSMIGIAAEDVDAAAVSILAALRRRTADMGGNG